MAKKAAQPRLKVSKADRAILNALSEPYRNALLYLHWVGAEDSLAHGHKPMTLVHLLQFIISKYLTATREYDEEARTAFEIMVAPDFIKSLKAWYETPEKDVTADA